MNNKPTVENEIKFLDIDADILIGRLNELGANKVYEGERTFVIFDTPEHAHFNAGNEIRLTLEGSSKLSYEILNSDGTKDSHKIKLIETTNLEHISAFFLNLNLFPIFKIISKRISYELNGNDIDIDWFPKLSPFVELDISGSDAQKDEIIFSLGLQNYEKVQFGTRQIYESKGLKYEDVFKIPDLN